VYHYIEGNKIKTKMFSDITDNVDDYDNLKELMSQWGKSLTNVFINNQNELGMVKLLEMSVENSNVVNYPISEDWDKEKHEYTIGLYIYIGVQLEKLKKIMQNLCSED
jgi:hypothetical protein